jgi:hypothetical protein
MILVRKNKDLKYVVIHHTEQYDDITGIDLNTIYNREGFFGVPYDIIINQNGNIDLSPRWVHGLTADSYVLNTRIQNIVNRYKIHHYAGLDLLEYNQKGIHIGIIGNFNVKLPSPLQYKSLLKVLNEISFRLKLPLNTALLYYSEIFTTSSPGILFFNKTKFYINNPKTVTI